VRGVGVGSPGTCNKDTGIVERSNNLGFVNLPMCKMLEEHLGVQVAIENDANAAALGEFKAGAAKGADSCVCITLGTGVGGGVIIDSKIFTGANFAGTELGHTVINVNGEPCSCGRKGCWEAYASATALVRQTRRAMEADKDSKMWEIAGSLENVDGRTAFDAMRAGDAAGTAVVDAYIYYIAVGLVDMINIFQPDVLCIGGGICKEGDTLLVPLQKYIEAERYSQHTEKQTVLCVAKLGNDAGVIGAACLID
ncbi:MAG: ROK family protein, partial [Clostridia bacterium]|nr:ROK family protein [Clostridia bacterium]